MRRGEEKAEKLDEHKLLLVFLSLDSNFCCFRGRRKQKKEKPSRELSTRKGKVFLVLFNAKREGNEILRENYEISFSCFFASSLSLCSRRRRVSKKERKTGKFELIGGRSYPVSKSVRSDECQSFPSSISFTIKTHKNPLPRVSFPVRMDEHRKYH